MPPGPPLLCRSVCRESKKSPMARSWRSFFKRDTDVEQESGPAVVEEGNGHLTTDLEAFVEETAEEVQVERKEPAPEDVWEVDEAPEAIAERQESAGWFGKLRDGLGR